MLRWRPETAGSRSLGVVAALAATLGVFLLLSRGERRLPAAAERQVAVELIRLPTARMADPLPASLARPPVAPTTPRRLERSARPPAAVIAAPAIESPVTPPVAGEEPPRRADAERQAASAPLRLDARALQRAIAGAEGQVRGMARASGAELDTPRQTQAEQLGAAVARTAVPDCLAPNAAGSLLSAPLLAFKAIRGQCK